MRESSENVLLVLIFGTMAYVCVYEKRELLRTPYKDIYFSEHIWKLKTLWNIYDEVICGHS